MKQTKLFRILLTTAVILLMAFTFATAPAVLGQASTAAAYETATSFRYPLDEGGWFVGQRFGVWNSGRSAYHLAEDLLPNDYRTELPVYAPANGKVVFSGYQTGGYGFMLVIEHRLPDGSYVSSVLGHLKRSDLAANGTEVSKGQLVGYISNNTLENGGYSFAHLHFGIRSGAYSTTRDPDNGWRYRGYTPHTGIRDLWYHPSNFVKAHSNPAPEPPQQTGSLSVSITPRGAVDAGAQWRIVGTSTWRNSGYTLSGIPANSYTVEFKDVSGWSKPANQSFTVNSARTSTLDGAYTQQRQDPILFSRSTSFNFGAIRRSNYATARSYTLVGAYLTNGIRVEAPAGFYVSVSPYSGYQRTLTLWPNSSGTISQKIYVSFAPNRVGTHSANIRHLTTGASRNVGVWGFGY